MIKFGTLVTKGRKKLQKEGFFLKKYFKIKVNDYS